MLGPTLIQYIHLFNFQCINATRKLVRQLTYCVIFVRDVYYTDWGDSARVVRMDLDGSHKNVLSVHFKNPNGITSIGNTLYVIDSNYKTAESGTGENSDHHQASLYSADRTGGDWKKQEASSLNLKVRFILCGFR